MTTSKQTTTQTTTREGYALEDLDIAPGVLGVLAEMEAARQDSRSLGPEDRAAYVAAICKSLRLNPLTRPVQFLALQGREVLYLTRGATDQLAARYGLNRETTDGPDFRTVEGVKIAFCKVKVTLPSGRFEYAVATLKMTSPADDLMKVECVPLDSEILTRRGFRRHDEVTIGEDVLAFDCATNACAWAPLDNVTVYPSAPVSRFATDGGGFSFRCTPNHSWAVDTMGGAGRKLIEAHAVKTHHRVRIAAPAPGGDHPLTPDLAAIIGWVMCDGGIKRVGNYVRLTITQSKPGRVAEIRALLARAGLSPRESVGDATVRTFPGGATYDCLPQHVFALRAEESRAVLAAAGIEGPADLPRLVTRLSQPARRAMLDAMLAADGTAKGHFGKKRKPGVMEAWQILSTLEGLALGKMGVSSVGDVPVQKALSYDYVAGSNLSLTPDGEEAVWCPTTRHGTWVMRQGGRISITGNTKAKRRATLSILGVGVLSEEEAESIPASERADARREQPRPQPSAVTLPRDNGPSPSQAAAAQPPAVDHFEAARALIDGAGTAEELAAARAVIGRDHLVHLGPTERTTITAMRDARAAALSAATPTPPDDPPPNGPRGRRKAAASTAPADATGAPADAANDPQGAAASAWEPFRTSDGVLIRDEAHARAVLRGYPLPRLARSSRLHTPAWGALCDAEAAERAAMPATGRAA